MKRAQGGHTAGAVADNDELASEFRHDVPNKLQSSCEKSGRRREAGLEDCNGDETDVGVGRGRTWVDSRSKWRSVRILT